MALTQLGTVKWLLAALTALVLGQRWRCAAVDAPTLRVHLRVLVLTTQGVLHEMLTRCPVTCMSGAAAVAAAAWSCSAGAYPCRRSLTQTLCNPAPQAPDPQ